MSCVLDILSLHELRTRKEHLLKQLKIVEEKILKKEKEEDINDNLEENNEYIIYEPKEIEIKNIIKIIKKNVEEKINSNNIENKNIKVRIKTLKK